MKRMVLACMVVVGCAHNVAQDKATGADGRSEGAQPIVLENGEGRAKGVVSYPGGDRVDWKLIKIPVGQRGRLDLAMKWTTPRPGLQLGFDVFDQYNHLVTSAKGSRGRLRDATVATAKGTYLVRVYAKGRGDAGAYELTAAFHPELVTGPVDPRSLDIPDPPRLPAVSTTPCEVFDRTDPACADACPEGAPAKWKGCAKAETPAPVPPTPVPPVPPMPPVATVKPFVARAIGANTRGGTVMVTISAGSQHGVTKTWRGRILRAGSTDPLPGGEITIIQVDVQRTTASVRVTSDTVNANPMIELSPP